MILIYMVVFLDASNKGVWLCGPCYSVLKNYSRGNFHLLLPDFCSLGTLHKSWKLDGLIAFLSLFIHLMECAKGWGSVSYTLHYLYRWSFNYSGNNGIGCFWKHHFVGAVCYADDVALLAPSPSALRNMLSTSIKFADSHHLSFNDTKT